MGLALNFRHMYLILINRFITHNKMRIHLKFKSLIFAEYTAEFLYNLHPIVLKQALEMKWSLGLILGFNDLRHLTYEQREQFVTLRSKEENN